RPCNRCLEPGGSFGGATFFPQRDCGKWKTLCGGRKRCDNNYRNTRGTGSEVLLSLFKGLVPKRRVAETANRGHRRGSHCLRRAFSGCANGIMVDFLLKSESYSRNSEG